MQSLRKFQQPVRCCILSSFEAQLRQEQLVTRYFPSSQYRNQRLYPGIVIVPCRVLARSQQHFSMLSCFSLARQKLEQAHVQQSYTTSIHSTMLINRTFPTQTSVKQVSQAKYLRQNIHERLVEETTRYVVHGPNGPLAVM